MKKFRTGILSLIFWLALSSGVCAEEGESVRLDDKGNVIISSSDMAEDGASTMSMTISVEAAETDSVEFVFAGIGAEVLEYRYNREEKKLLLYIAGVNSLFPAGTDTLTIGQIVVKDGNGAGVSTNVRIEDGAIQYVYGSEVRRPEGMAFPGAVQIGAGSSASPPPPADSDTSSTGGTSQGNSGSSGQEPGGDSEKPGNTGQGTGGQGSQANPSPIPVSPTPVTPTPAPTEGEEGKDQDGKQESDPDAPSVNPLPGSSETDREADGKAVTGEKSGIDGVIILAIGGIVLFVGVVLWAFVTLNRKPRR